MAKDKPAGVRTTKVESAADLAGLPRGMSVFEPLLAHEVKEAIEAGGEAHVAYDAAGAKNGLFVYDAYEATGTVFTRSKEVFEHFYRLKPSSYVFSELLVEGLPKEDWSIWQLDVAKGAKAHRFRHHVSIAEDPAELERFIAKNQPETNPRWIRVALRNGDRCFVVRVSGRIVGVAWLTVVGSIARSHGLYVEPPYRRTGMMRDSLQARLIYLKSRGVRTLINEIADANRPSAAHAANAGERVVGKLYLYSTPD